MIVRLYEDCMGHMHLRVEENIYCNVQQLGGSFHEDVLSLLHGGQSLGKALSYRVVSGMFTRMGGPRLLAVWKDGETVLFKTPHTPSGCGYLSSSPKSPVSSP